MLYFILIGTCSFKKTRDNDFRPKTDAILYFDSCLVQHKPSKDTPVYIYIYIFFSSQNGCCTSFWSALVVWNDPATTHVFSPKTDSILYIMYIDSYLPEHKPSKIFLPPFPPAFVHPAHKFCFLISPARLEGMPTKKVCKSTRQSQRGWPQVIFVYSSTMAWWHKPSRSQQHDGLCCFCHHGGWLIDGECHQVAKWKRKIKSPCSTLSQSNNDLS